MIYLQEEGVSYSDNSHLFDVPFIIKEELHSTITYKRGNLHKLVEKFVQYPMIEYHVNFEKEVI